MAIHARDLKPRVCTGLRGSNRINQHMPPKLLAIRSHGLRAPSCTKNRCCNIPINMKQTYMKLLDILFQVYTCVNISIYLQIFAFLPESLCCWGSIACQELFRLIPQAVPSSHGYVCGSLPLRPQQLPFFWQPVLWPRPSRGFCWPSQVRLLASEVCGFLRHNLHSWRPKKNINDLITTSWIACATETCIPHGSPRKSI